jgi:hypothetical protein
LARTQTRAADQPPPPSFPACHSNTAKFAVRRLRYGLAAKKLRQDTDVTPIHVVFPSSADGESPTARDCVFQICSRLDHQEHHNTNFTDFEAGDAGFFACDLTKGLSYALC